MSDSTTTIKRYERTSETKLIELSAKKPYEQVLIDFEKQLWRFDQDAAMKASDLEATIHSMTGELGLMIIHVLEMSALLPSLASAETRARQYLIGNPLIASQMAKFDPRAALFAPPRVLIHSNGDDTHITFEKPSTTFGRLFNPLIDETAIKLDDKFETLVQKALSP